MFLHLLILNDMLMCQKNSFTLLLVCSFCRPIWWVLFLFRPCSLVSSRWDNMYTPSKSSKHVQNLHTIPAFGSYGHVKLASKVFLSQQHILYLIYPMAKLYGIYNITWPWHWKIHHSYVYWLIFKTEILGECPMMFWPTHQSHPKSLRAAWFLSCLLQVERVREWAETWDTWKCETHTILHILETHCSSFGVGGYIYPNLQIQHTSSIHS